MKGDWENECFMILKLGALGVLAFQILSIRAEFDWQDFPCDRSLID